MTHVPLPSGWKRVAVSDVGDVQLGLKKSPDRNTGEGRTPYLRAANVIVGGLDLSDVLSMDIAPAEREKYRLAPGDILLAEASGSASHVGRAAIWRGEIPDVCYQMTLIRFRARAVIPEFALLAFRHLAVSGAIADASRGIGIKHLSAHRLAALPFLLPPLPEQKRIANEAFRRLKEAAAARERLETALHRTKQQDCEVLGCTLSDTFAARVSSRPQGNTNGWEWARVRDVGESRVGRQLGPATGVTVAKPYLRVANVFEDRIDYEDVKTMDFAVTEFDRYRLLPGDVLLNEGQSIELVGRPAMYRGEIAEIGFQNSLIRFRAGPEVLPEYALLVFRHYFNSGGFSDIAKHSTNIAHLGLARFESMRFPVPPIDAQGDIVKEARRRLEASHGQREFIMESLRRLDDLERQIVESAATGTLVPQDASEESADAALVRLSTDQSSRSRDDARDSSHSVKTTRKTRRSEAAGLTTNRSLDQVLAETGPLSIPDLLVRAGYDRNDNAEIEAFYITLREHLGKTIRVHSSSGENAILESSRETR